MNKFSMIVLMSIILPPLSQAADGGRVKALRDQFEQMGKAQQREEHESRRFHSPPADQSVVSQLKRKFEPSIVEEEKDLPLPTDEQVRIDKDEDSKQLDASNSDLRDSVSTDNDVISRSFLNRVKVLNPPRRVKENVVDVDIDRILKLQGKDKEDKEIRKIKIEAARKKGMYPKAPTPTIDYLDFLKIDMLHQRRLSGDGIKIGVVDSWFDYSPDNIKNALTQSTLDLAPKKGTNAYLNNELRYNVGFSGEKGEFAVTGHHGNHVTSIIHEIAPSSPIKYINFQAEQGIEGKEPHHYVLAIKRAVESGVDFINFSLKFPYADDPMDADIRNELIKAAQSSVGIVIALGNDEQDSEQNLYVKDLIALSESKEMGGRMILVGASQYKGNKERLAAFSNRPSPFISARKVIIAPGDSIKALGAGGVPVVKSGTSQATPIVTGVSALIKEYLVKLTLKNEYGAKLAYTKNEIIEAKDKIKPETVFSILLRTARPETVNLSMEFGKEYGRGILNPEAAANYAREYTFAHYPKKEKRQWLKKKEDLERNEYLRQMLKKKEKVSDSPALSPPQETENRAWIKKKKDLESNAYLQRTLKKKEMANDSPVLSPPKARIYPLREGEKVLKRDEGVKNLRERVNQYEQQKQSDDDMNG